MQQNYRKKSARFEHEIETFYARVIIIDIYNSVLVI